MAIRNLPEYRAYQAAKGRCQNPKHKLFKYYGERGIEFRFDSFKSFLDILGFRPSSKYSLDRINNNGHYEPGNVRWATKQEQVLNRNLQCNNTSGYKNIHWYPQTNKWVVHIKRNRKQFTIGYYFTIEEAVHARDFFLKELENAS